jgi:heat shock protein HslJ
MRAGALLRLCLVVAPFAILAACSSNRQIADQQGETGSAQLNTLATLAGTAWRLVEIVSMDDSVYAPDDPSLYTLEFKANGAARVRADCNLGTGSWTSESAGQLRFGQIATTQALCAPGSLHDRYLAQFPWVRSYVMKDGRLFLATMADGSIVEFEPVPGK